jgi:transcriptional regulator with XRE-family HTH domain
MDEADYDQLPVSAVGADLRAAREAQGLSLADIADRTRIPARHIEAIEQSQYSTLPAATYSTGFVRTYSRLLGLDSANLSQRFRAEIASHEPERSYLQQPYEPADPARVPSRGLVWITLAIAVIGALGYFYWRGSRLENPAKVATAPVAESQAAPPAAKPLQPAQAPVFPAAALEIAPQPVPGQTALLTAEQPAWLRITDGTNKLFQGVLNPGDHFQIPATATDPRLRTSRATALKVTVGTVTIPPLGPPETLIKEVSLKPDALLARATGNVGTAAAMPPR